MWKARVLAVGWAVLALAGCGGGDSGGQPPGPPAPAAMRAGPADGAPTAPADIGSQGIGHTRVGPGDGRLFAPRADGPYAIDIGSREAVRLFYRSVHASSDGVDPGWTGNVASCQAGDTSAEYKAAVLRRLNWYRAMAGVPSLRLDAALSARAQQSALLMSANNALSHNPPTSWKCWNATGAEGAGAGNIYLGRSGPSTVDGYIQDSGGNNARVGHRRWLLYPQTVFVGTGDIEGPVRSNTISAYDANLNGPRPAVRDGFVAWPPPGYVPHPVVYARWSFSYPGADFSQATVSLRREGTELPLRVEPPSTGFIGENTLVWMPADMGDDDDWPRPAADTAYEVSLRNVRVGGVARDFSYRVTVFDPDTGPPLAPPVQGPDHVVAGQPAAFSLPPVAGANSYEWRLLSATAGDFLDSAEAGLGNFIAATSPEYSPLASGVAASGASAFLLAHTRAVDQVLTLKGGWHATPQAALSFASRLGWATPDQRAQVEVSTDGGRHWTPVYQQAGTDGRGETAFVQRSVPLAALAGSTFQLRLRYAFSTGTYYYQAGDGTGWYVDDLRLTGVEAVTELGAPRPADGGGFTLAEAPLGTLLLQARAGYYGYHAGWGTARRVVVAVAPAAPAPWPLPVLAECLFNWAERQYPGLFAPRSGSSRQAPYYYRYYAATNAHLGVSSLDGHVYYLAGGGQLEDLGPAAGWAATAACR